MRERPEITHLTWVDARRRVRPANGPCCTCPVAGRHARPPALPRKGSDNEPEHLPRRARAAHAGLFARLRRRRRGPVFQLQVPLIERNAFAGTLVAEYSVERWCATSCRPTWRSAT
jgi:hypothetical protein